MAKADSGVLPYHEDFDETLRRLWNGKKIPWDVIQKRTGLLAWLNEIHPLELQAQGIDGTFTKLFSFYRNPRLYAPALYYRILPNEIVFDIDSDDIKESFEATKEIVSLLRSLGCKFTVGFSGNRGFHVHIITTAQNMPPSEFAKVVTKEWRDALFGFLLEFVPKLQEYVDIGVMTAKAHTIRAFYSLNLKTMKWKTFVKPFKGYEVWEIPTDLGKRVSRYLYEQMEVREALKIAEKEVEEEKNKDRFVVPNNVVELVLQKMKPYLAKEYEHYIAYHCPFHPPDRHPSFIIFKPNPSRRTKDGQPCDFWFAVDYHDGVRYSMRKLYLKLKSVRS